MTNIEMLSLVARGLGSLKDGPTDDVDCVVEVVSRVEYHKIEERLRVLGFRHPIDDKTPICRWQYKGVLVDVMPIEGKILGFSNRWYAEGFERSVVTKLPDGQNIRIFALPYLVASKLEAFKDRGKADFMGSADLEDIVVLLDGVPDFQGQILRAPAALRAYLLENFEGFFREEMFIDALEGHIPPVGRGERVQRIKTILKKFSSEGAEPSRDIN